MFQFVGRFEKLTLQGARFSTAWKQALETQMRQASREFLRAVIVRVPVYTGMARGSLQPVGRFLRVAVPIRPDPRARLYPDKNPGRGRALGGFNFSNKGGFSPNLSINIGVLHFQLNEFRSSKLKLRHPTPWRSFDAGRAAFRAYLRRNLAQKVPRINSFVVRTRVRIK